MKILNFGSCNIDYTYSLNHIVVPGETISTYNLKVSCGGKGLNQSIAVARAGEKVFHAGCIGNDGEMLSRALSKNGVDVSNLKSIDTQNGHAIIQVDKKGENSILLYGGSNEMITKDFIEQVLEKFEFGDILILQNEINNVDYIISKAHSRGMKIILNPAPFGENIKRMDFNMLSYLILNEVEAKEFTGKKQPEDIIHYMREKHPKLKIVLTLGKEGCIYADKEQILYQPSFKVDAVDTTGAGDTFIGYFVAEIAKNKSYAEAIKTASAASALAVSEKGASDAIPLRSEVIKAAKVLKVRKRDKSEYILEQTNYYIEENLKTATLSELAKNLNYSTSYTSEILKRNTGKTFSQLLQEKRCICAARLLRETELSIEEIADAIGYQNRSFFRKKFKEFYKTTPYKYRKM